MAERRILELGDPRLHVAAQRVEDPAQVADVIRDLADTLAAFRARTGFGRAIAAPQIGEAVRVLVARVPGGFQDALVNPRVTWASEERFELWDDCFSFPDLMVRVSRHARVRVAYADASGVVRTIDAEGGLAELLQHEIDHLDGILAIERAVSPRAFMTRAEWLRQRGR